MTLFKYHVLIVHDQNIEMTLYPTTLLNSLLSSSGPADSLIFSVYDHVIYQ